MKSDYDIPAYHFSIVKKTNIKISEEVRPQEWLVNNKTKKQ